MASLTRDELQQKSLVEAVSRYSQYLDLAAEFIVSRSGMTEHWRAIPGHEDYYEASTEGRIRSWLLIGSGRRKRRAESPLVMKLVPGSGGYLNVCIGEKNKKAVHVLILETFRGPAPDGTEAAHGNGNRQDNRLANLRWATHQENMDDQKLHGTVSAGELNPNAKLTWARVNEMRDLYAAGVPQSELVEIYGIKRSQVNKIVRGLSWRT